MVDAQVEGIVNRILEEVYDCVADEFDDSFHVESGRGLSGYFSGVGPDIVVSQQVNRIPSELEDADNLENFFPDDEFEIPRVGIEVKYQTDTSYSDQRIENMSLGPPLSDDRYPEKFLLLHEEGVTQNIRSQYQDDDWVLITDVLERNNIRNDVAPRVNERLSSLQDTLSGEFKEMDQYISSLHSTVFHFNEVLRGYEAGQTGALVVLLSVYFESHCYRLLEDYAEEGAPNPLAGNFVDEDDRFEVMLKACRLLDLIGESEFGAINQVRKARNTFAHDITGYNISQGSEIGTTELETAIRVYEDLIGVRDSMIS